MQSSAAKLPSGVTGAHRNGFEGSKFTSTLLISNTWGQVAVTAMVTAVQMKGETDPLYLQCVGW